MWPPYILANKQKSLTCFKIEIKFSSVKNLSLPFSIGGQVAQTVKNLVSASYVWMVITMVFPVVMYGCESWTITKAECQRIDAFELWFRNPLDSKETQPVHPKENQS